MKLFGGKGRKTPGRGPAGEERLRLSPEELDRLVDAALPDGARSADVTEEAGPASAAEAPQASVTVLPPLPPETAGEEAGEPTRRWRSSGAGAGAAGAMGAAGMSGASGTVGAAGTARASGNAETTGAAGTARTTGAAGTAGVPGAAGAQAYGRENTDVPAASGAVAPGGGPPQTETKGFAGVAALVRRHRGLFIGLGALVLVLVAGLALHAVLVRAPSTLDEGLHQPAATLRPAVTGPIATPPPTPSLTPPPQETPLPTQPSTYRREDCYTFALLVCDQISGSTDTVLAGRLDTEGGTLDLVSIPRDTLVDVSWPVKKLNTIYKNERNDPGRFLDHLSGLIGFRADHYAVMDLRAVERIVDAMGGVTYDLPRSMDYDDPGQNLSIHLSAGPQTLSGADVVKALRFRIGNDGTGYPDGDLGRIRFQQELLSSVASQLLRLGNIPNLPAILSAVTENVKTDLTAENLTFYAEQFLLLQRDGVRFRTAPGTAINIRGGSYYELDIRGWLELVNDALDPYSTPVSEQNLDILHYLGPEGVISTTGDTLPLSRFYDFRSEAE